jgi:hypothetical protein
MKPDALIACRSSMVRGQGSVDFEATQRTFVAVLALFIAFLGVLTIRDSVYLISQLGMFL